MMFNDFSQPSFLHLLESWSICPLRNCCTIQGVQFSPLDVHNSQDILSPSTKHNLEGISFFFRAMWLFFSSYGVVTEIFSMTKFSPSSGLSVFFLPLLTISPRNNCHRNLLSPRWEIWIYLLDAEMNILLCVCVWWENICLWSIRRDAIQVTLYHIRKPPSQKLLFHFKLYCMRRFFVFALSRCLVRMLKEKMKLLARASDEFSTQESEK